VEVEGLSGIDWSAPWFAALADVGRAIASAGDWRGELDRAARARRVCSARGQALRFVEPDAAGAEPYESFIARTGEVPTRASLHDVFNALVWLRFPATKARLNSLQAAAIARNGIGARRGPLRDAVTLIDESGVLLVTKRASIVSSLRDHEWDSLFVKQRASWTADVQLIVFGHALLQKLAHPYKAITAHALHLSLECETSLDAVDQCAAAALDDRLSPSDLLPIPVLGVPGWCRLNSDPIFYADSAVFRPVNMRRQQIGENRFDETRRS
jgi:hypothetical protein